MNKFEIFNNTKEDIVELKTINDFLEYALNYLKIKNSIFNVIIVSEKEIRTINREYRNKDSITDVISFALEDDRTFIETDFNVLGDIYICLKRAKNQAIEYNHSFLRELAFLSIHGLLHLLGYDHIKEEDEKVMFSLQTEILDSYGIKRGDNI